MKVTLFDAAFALTILVCGAGLSVAAWEMYAAATGMHEWACGRYLASVHRGEIHGDDWVAEQKRSPEYADCKELQR